MWIAYALSQLPSGVLADRSGERGGVLVALATTARRSASMQASGTVRAAHARLT